MVSVGQATYVYVCVIQLNLCNTDVISCVRMMVSVGSSFVVNQMSVYMCVCYKRSKGVCFSRCCLNT